MKSRQEMWYRSYARFNDELFLEELGSYMQEINGIMVDKPESMNNYADKFVNNIVLVLDKYAPFMRRRVNVKLYQKPWISPVILQQLKERDRMYRKAVESNTDINWYLFRQKRNYVVELIRKSKSNWYESEIEECGRDSGKMWKVIKRLVKGNVNKDNNEQGILFGNVQYTDDLRVAEEFNKYYVNSINEIVKSIGVNQIVDYDGQVNEIDMTMRLNKFEEISVIDLKNIISKLGNKKGTNEGITIKILKLVVGLFAEEYVKIINASLTLGTFPENWKTSLIVPVPKVNNTNKGENFRPINMLPMYEKVLEIVVKKQIYNYLETNRLWTPCQSGFRNSHSCETALQYSISEWKKRCDIGECIVVVFIDLKRAFETVDRGMLVKKLRMYGLGDEIVRWFDSYLKNRKQQVKYNGVLSEPVDCNVGVPQGSVLGPLLFNIYINDIVKHIRNCDIRMFADDMILCRNGKDYGRIVLDINEDLRYLNEWLVSNRLKINVDKTKYIIIRGAKKNIQCTEQIKINNISIERVTQIKYLGVIIDECLNFKEHVSYICKKVNKKVSLLWRIGRYVDGCTRCQIYKTVISPHFDYCSTLLYNINETSYRELQLCQNRAMRAIIRCNIYTQIMVMLDTLQFLTVRERIQVNVYVFIWKMLRGDIPGYLTEKLKVRNEIHDYGTRYNNYFYVDMRRTVNAQRDLYCNGLNSYNRLPEEMKNTSNVKAFRKQAIMYVKSMRES
jgi:hypothetical protein